MTPAHDGRSLLRTMFETYRMLGRDHEVELERLARTGSRATKRRAPLRTERRVAARLPLPVRLAVAKLKAFTG